MFSLSRRRAVLLIAGVALLSALSPLFRVGQAAAHPLGNFTINHYDRIVVSDRGFEIYRVLDMAEIPTFQERQKIDTDGDGDVSDAESADYAAAKAGELMANIALRINGQTAELREVSHAITFPPGQGGLRLLRLTATYSANLPDDWRTSRPKIDFEDTNYAGRLGWREILIRDAGGIALVDPTVGSEDVSEELTAYPTDALSNPLDVSSVSFSIRSGDGVVATSTPDQRTRAVRGNPDSTLGRFANLIAKDNLSAGVIVVTLLAALGFGALHALSPGHGKTIVAAYLVGSRGTARHALLLGLTVTATHTSSVYALGFVTLYLSEYVVPETLYPWLGVTSGGLIVLMGMSLFVGRLSSSGLVGRARRALRGHISGEGALARVSSLALAGASPSAGLLGSSLRAGPSHLEGTGDHGHESGAHAHRSDDRGGHRHGVGPAHAHTIPGQDGEPVTWRRLVGLGIFGGLLPCPSAIVVMLSAISLHRVGFGLVLILFFSLGLAGVLTGIGFLLIYAKLLTQRLPVLASLATRAGSSSRMAIAARTFPIASAAAVVAAGAFITGRAFGQF